MKNNMIYRKAISHFLETELDGELVLMNTKSGRFHALKDTGLSIWRLIDGSNNLESIKDMIVDQYGIDAQTCDIEVKAFVDAIVEAGLVEPA